VAQSPPPAGSMPEGKKEGRRKADDKALMKEKASQRDWELAHGITKPVRQGMNADSLLCMECKATQLGPVKCECVGGRRPPTGGYAESPEGLLDLAAAAKERLAAQSAATRAAQAAQQSAVQKAKAQTKAGKLLDDSTLDLSQLDSVEVEFEPGKLGFSIERNVVSAVAEGGPAAEKKVAAGWVIRKVQGEEVPPDKAKLMKMAAVAMKKGPTTFVFQMPLEEGTHHCKDCDKFVAADDFDAGALDAGPGKQVCYSCSQYAEAGW